MRPKYTYIYIYIYIYIYVCVCVCIKSPSYIGTSGQIYSLELNFLLNYPHFIILGKRYTFKTDIIRNYSLPNSTARKFCIKK